MVLLNLLRQHPGVKLTVAHFDHGIREDSAIDRKLVQGVAKQHNLPFVHGLGRLGPDASEATARAARYKFLDSVKQAANAKAIITAHHQDDMLETAIINILRGSGRRGLTALKDTEKLKRPLLGYSKQQIRDYAIAHALQWREDPSNADTKYLRNHVRHKVLSKFTDGQRAQLLILLEQLAETNKELDQHLDNLLHVQPEMSVLSRSWFTSLPHAAAAEVLHTWLRRHDVSDITSKTIERLIVAMKTGKSGQKIDVDRGYVLNISRNQLALQDLER